MAKDVEKKIEEVKEKVKEEVKRIPYDEELVSYTAPSPTENDEDDIFVGVRGKRWKIQRGATVQIPRYVLWAINDAKRQAEEAYKRTKKIEEQSRQAFLGM